MNIDSKVDNIGNNSTLDDKDVTYLTSIIDVLREHGEYSKAIYLGELIRNANKLVSSNDVEKNILDLSTFNTIINESNKRNTAAWEMYANGAAIQIISKINREILELLKVNKNISKLKFYIDYQKLYDITNQRPPYKYDDGIRLIITYLMNKINSSNDWYMKIKKCTKYDASFVIMMNKK